MTDRELLEMAAKAAGLIIVDEDDDLTLYVINQHDKKNGDECGERWAPLEDDGDALRLAVDLSIDVYPWISAEDPTSSAMARNSHGFRAIEFVSKNRGCRHAATRRAIVRAAAAIGESMP